MQCDVLGASCSFFVVLCVLDSSVGAALVSLYPFMVAFAFRGLSVSGPTVSGHQHTSRNVHLRVYGSCVDRRVAFAIPYATVLIGGIVSRGAGFVGMSFAGGGCVMPCGHGYILVWTCSCVICGNAFGELLVVSRFVCFLGFLGDIWHYVSSDAPLGDMLFPDGLFEHCLI